MKNATSIISVLLIPADLTKPCTMVNIRKGDYALKDMYKHMDCDYVQRLHVQRLETPKKNMILWVDEEGRLLLALEGKRNPKTNVRGSLLAKEQIFGNVILAGQDSLYDVDGIEFDTIKGLVKKLEDTAQMVIAKHPQMNQ